ncbi:EpsG family protein [uncultured Duncaniella sp.]|uniref:EpsG family protein n=4 Tax=uncultured Duncaniella sp. TaxID=2768039 RepID=UPI002611B142|nr:EpsG family protein [uncultured Duncaniella sp.]
MIYLFILIIIIISTYYFDIKNIKHNKWAFYWLICLILICLSGFRYHIGIDPIYYEKNWNTYPNFWDFNWNSDILKFRENSEVARFHIGWIFYVMIIQVFSKSFIAAQICNAVIINCAIFKLIKTYSKHPFSVILIYYCSFTFIEFNFELMRETIAVAIFLMYGIKYYLSKKWIKYYLIVLLAYSFHPSAMMMFLLPLIRNLKWGTKQYIVFFIIPAILIGLGGRAIVGNMLNTFLGADAYATRYFAGGRENNFNYFLMYAFRPTVLLGLILLFKRHITNPQFIPIFFFSIFFMYIGTLIYTAARFTNYIIIIDYIVIADILFVLCKHFKSILVYLIYLFLLFIPNIYQYSSPTNLARHYPYRSIFYDHPTDMQRLVERNAQRGLR